VKARPVASASQARVQVIAPTALGTTAVAALRARGVDARLANEAKGAARNDAVSMDPGTDDVVAWALDAPPGTAATVELAQLCARAATAGRPICLLAPPPKGSGRAAAERAAALAYLRAHGAALAHDVDAWLEATVALVRFGLPKGPRAAIIAPAGSWLEAQAHALVAEAEALGLRAPKLDAGGTDAVLFDPDLDPALGPSPGDAPGEPLAIPVAARPELGGDGPALFGARAALAAIDVLGHAAERIEVGIGPAPAKASAELGIERDKLDRNFGKLVAGTRVGDHETKLLLSAYGVPVTRQIVATTPSAAVNGARRVGFPVEIKPWGPDAPTERDGCPVERSITSDAMVRRGYAAVLAAGGKPGAGKPGEGAVIVREVPPLGRDLQVSFLKVPHLGWTVVVDATGAPHVAAAPAPLRLLDAQRLAAALVASRAGDPEPDRAGLANLMRRASHFVVDLGDRLSRLELPRVIVGGRGSRSVVADAWCELV
jgi:hypothetical protein